MSVVIVDVLCVCVSVLRNDLTHNMYNSHQSHPLMHCSLILLAMTLFCLRTTFRENWASTSSSGSYHTLISAGDTLSHIAQCVCIIKCGVIHILSNILYSTYNSGYTKCFK